MAIPPAFPDYIVNNIATSFPAGIAGGGSGVPAWVISGAAIDMDFATGRYYGGTLTALLSVSRASSATDLLWSSASGYAYNTYGNNVAVVSPSIGLLIFGGATNLLLNSAVPATQTTASLGTGSYTFWVNGSGSALVSAGSATITGASAATNGSPNTFTVTGAGTVTATVTGSLNAFQLEAGSFPTSFIVTTGATATRASDAITAASTLLTTLNADPLWLLAQTKDIQNWAANAIVVCSGPAFNRTLITTSSVASNQCTAFDGVVLTATAGSGTFLGPAKTIITGDASGRSMFFNNGALATDLGLLGTVSTGMTIGYLTGSGTRHLDGIITRLTVGQARLSNAAAAALTV